MITFSQIKNKSDHNFNDMLNLYQTAFPEYERRSKAALISILNNHSTFKATAITSKDNFIGLLNYWTFDEFYYVEHFAISAQFRNKKNGTEGIKKFINLTKQKPIVIEVEPPKTLAACKRINFYERLDFYILSQHYLQPSYRDNNETTAMYLMSNNYQFTNKNFEMIQKTLQNEVYNVK